MKPRSFLMQTFHELLHWTKQQERRSSKASIYFRQWWLFLFVRMFGASPCINESDL